MGSQSRQAARHVLAEVDAAVIDDTSLASLEFTLDICETFLPLGTAVTHRSRLNWTISGLEPVSVRRRRRPRGRDNDTDFPFLMNFLSV
jgi:hypothetical protein